MPYSLPRLKYFFLKNNFIYLFLAILGLGVAVSWDYSLVVMLGPLTVGLLSQSMGSRAPWLQYLQLSGSTAQAQQLWHMGLAVPWHVGSSQIRGRTCISCLGRQILYY